MLSDDDAASKTYFCSDLGVMFLKLSSRIFMEDSGMIFIIVDSIIGGDSLMSNKILYEFYLLPGSNIGC